MHSLRAFLPVLIFSGAAVAGAPRGILVNCFRGVSLQAATSLAPPHSVLNIRGTCKGGVTISADGLQLNGTGDASVNGAGQDVITIDGAQGVTLTGLGITGGNNGVVAKNGAQVSLQNDTIEGNAITGILVEANSSATVSGGDSNSNGLDGIDVESTSSLVVNGSYSTTGNGVFGIDVNNGSSLTLTDANLSVENNAVGVQLGTNASGFLDGQSALNTSNNAAVGLTMVSGAHMVDFGGKITSDGNGINGISLNSKAGLDCDAGSQVESSNNGGDGVHLEQLSVMTVFNNPSFSGASGTTTLTTEGNQGDGINLLTNSAILVDNVAAVTSTGNTKAGLALDDGSSASFGQTIPVSNGETTITGNKPDVSLTFGSRLTTLANDKISTITCDATALVRGAVAVTCPTP
jgi:hypothetical protein